MNCNNSTKRWCTCKNRAVVRLVTHISKFGFPVHDGPLDLFLCNVHKKGWMDQIENAPKGVVGVWVF